MVGESEHDEKNSKTLRYIYTLTVNHVLDVFHRDYADGKRSQPL
jgi:hypothetical protein